MQPNKNKELEGEAESRADPHRPEIRQQILEIFNKLNREIETLDTKVELLIEQHEGEFVHAYQNHVKKIKIDLEALKSRSDEQDKELKNNNKVVFLEKQAMLFRDESLKLYERLQAKTQQAEYYKFRAKDLQKTNYIMQKQIRQTMKNRKLMQAKILSSQAQLIECNQQLLEKNQQIKNLTQMLSGTYQPPNLKGSYLDPQNLHGKLKQSAKQMMASKIEKTSTGPDSRKRSKSLMRQSKDSQLKEWFIQCVRSIKKEVASRKGNTGLLNLDNIVDIRQFMMTDKLRLLQKLLQNESLLVWMYEKIFPSRSNELRQYLTHRNLSTNEQKMQTLPDSNPSSFHLANLDRSGVAKEQTEMQQKLEISLPKMRKSHHHSFSHSSNHRANQISNRVSFKEGKLRIINP